MRIVFCFLIGLAPLLFMTGCGGPDPRAEPDFDQEAFDDPNMAAQRMQAPESP